MGRRTATDEPRRPTRPTGRGAARVTLVAALAGGLVAATVAGTPGRAGAAPERPRIGLCVSRGGDAALLGVRRALALGGFDAEVYEQRVGTDDAAARAAVAAFGVDGVDAVLAVGPVAARAARDGGLRSLVVFTGTTRPEAHALPGRSNVCGTADGAPADLLLRTVRRALPSADAVALLAPENDLEAIDLETRLRAADSSLVVTRTSLPGSTQGFDVAATHAALGSAGVVLCTESVSVRVVERIAGRMQGSGRLLVGTRREHLAAGAVLVVRIDPADAGMLAVSLLRRVIAGEDPATLRVVVPARRRVELSLAAARRLGVQLPLRLVAGADRVVPLPRRRR